MVVAAAMSSISSTGLLNLQVARAQPAVAVHSSHESSRNLSERAGLLRWDPLRNSCGLRTSTSSSSSSSSSPSCLYLSPLSRNFRKLSPRASNLEGDEINEEESKTEAAEKESHNVLGKLLSSAAKPAVVAAMVALLAAQPSEDAFAASSGGRVGGKVFSKPAPSRSYSGGGGGGGVRPYSGGGGGYGGGYYVAPPTYGLSPFGFSPFYGGGYGSGLFYGPSVGFGGGGAIFLAMIAFAGLSAVARFVRSRFGNREQDEDQFDDE